jgi:putative Mg2+ transporter-C (MgtC) family protein
LDDHVAGRTDGYNKLVCYWEGLLMLGWFDIIFRLGAAMLVGSLIGIYLELRQKPTGMRTLGLVALASAVAVLAVASKDPDADASRVIQGVITGIGFLGAGVIIHGGTGQMVHGLSTAATIWITASLGVLCGLAAWPLLAVAFVFTVFLLIAGAAVEKWLQGRRLVSDEQ